LKNAKNEQAIVTPKARQNFGGVENLEPIATKFCMSGAVHDIITHANFGAERLRGFGVARGRILAFSIDLLRRLYNTLALQCECVISIFTEKNSI